MPEEEKDENQDSSPEAGAETIKEDVKIPAEKAPEKKPEEQMIPKSRFDEVYKELKTLKEKPAPVEKPAVLNVEDYIDISASLEGLDQRQKEKLAQEHKLTGKPLSEIRKSEDFLLWNTGYQAKVEKEQALNPSTRQPEVKQEKTFEEIIEETKGANPFKITPEREKLMEDAGLWKSPKGPRGGNKLSS